MSPQIPDTKVVMREWMQTVMLENNWTIDKWAKKAGTTPTNLTRILNNNYSLLPTLRTFVKLVNSAGSIPEVFDVSVSKKMQRFRE